MCCRPTGCLVDGMEQVAEPSAFLLVPKGVPHAARRVTDEPVRMLTVVSPSGLQRFFESVVREGEEQLLAHPKGWPPWPPSSAARSLGITRTSGERDRTIALHSGRHSDSCCLPRECVGMRNLRGTKCQTAQEVTRMSPFDTPETGDGPPCHSPRTAG